jgi:hypothetical protein
MFGHLKVEIVKILQSMSPRDDINPDVVTVVYRDQVVPLAGISGLADQPDAASLCGTVVEALLSENAALREQLDSARMSLNLSEPEPSCTTCLLVYPRAGPKTTAPAGLSLMDPHWGSLRDQPELSS